MDGAENDCGGAPCTNGLEYGYLARLPSFATWMLQWPGQEGPDQRANGWADQPWNANEQAISGEARKVVGKEGGRIDLGGGIMT